MYVSDQRPIPEISGMTRIMIRIQDLDYELEITKYQSIIFYQKK